MFRMIRSNLGVEIQNAIKRLYLGIYKSIIMSQKSIKIFKIKVSKFLAVIVRVKNFARKILLNDFSKTALHKRNQLICFNKCDCDAWRVTHVMHVHSMWYGSWHYSADYLIKHATVVRRNKSVTVEWDVTLSVTLYYAWCYASVTPMKEILLFSKIGLSILIRNRRDLEPSSAVEKYQIMAMSKV